MKKKDLDFKKPLQCILVFNCPTLLGVKVRIAIEMLSDGPRDGAASRGPKSGAKRCLLTIKPTKGFLLPNEIASDFFVSYLDSCR